MKCAYESGGGGIRQTLSLLAIIIIITIIIFPLHEEEKFPGSKIRNLWETL